MPGPEWRRALSPDHRLAALCRRRSVGRHRLIYQALGEAMGREIHALSIRAYTGRISIPTQKETHEFMFVVLLWLAAAGLVRLRRKARTTARCWPVNRRPLPRRTTRITCGCAPASRRSRTKSGRKGGARRDDQPPAADAGALDNKLDQELDVYSRSSATANTLARAHGPQIPQDARSPMKSEEALRAGNGKPYGRVPRPSPSWRAAGGGARDHQQLTGASFAALAKRNRSTSAPAGKAATSAGSIRAPWCRVL